MQTNSLNYGYNIISKNIINVIYFLWMKESSNCLRGENVDHQKSLKIYRGYYLQKGFLTCGGKFSMLYSGNKIYKLPLLNKKAVDTIGAGDIFHAVASVMSYVSKNDNLNLLLAQIAGAHAVEIVGNSDYPKISELFNTLNFYKSYNNKKLR